MANKSFHRWNIKNTKEIKKKNQIHLQQELSFKSPTPVKGVRQSPKVLKL